MSGQSGQQRRYLHIVFFVFGLLLLSYLARYLVEDLYESNWDSASVGESGRILEEAASRFIALQRETRRIGTDLAGKPVIASYLEGLSSELSPLFREIENESRTHSAGIEVYDRNGRLLVWGGPGGPVSEQDITRALNGTLTSYIIPSPLYSQLLVATPVRTGTEISGVVVVRKLIDSHFPLNNRYVESEGLSESIQQDLGVPVRFHFSHTSRPDTVPGSVSAPLIGIDSTLIGTVSVPVSTLAPTLTRIGTMFSYGQAFLQVLIVVLLVLLLRPPLTAIRNVFLRSLAVTGLIWGLRYLLLWLEIPSGFFSGPVFDPAFYATKFGNGIAKSIGELTVTSVALVINTLLVTRFLVGRQPEEQTWRTVSRTLIGFPVALVSVGVFFLLLRAYGVLIRSAVFDSALRYNDPSVIIPSFELALMVVNLFTVSLCIIIVSAGLLFLAVSRVSAGNRIAGWALVAGLLVAGALISGFLGSKNLMTTEYRVLFSAAMILYSYYLSRTIGSGVPRPTPGGLLIPLALSALFLYPQLNARTAERDRERIEVFAGEVLRPVDSWLTFVVDDALNNFRDAGVGEILRRGSADEIERVALTVWSRSAACREGYNSLFLVTDSLGREVSRFSIGDQDVLPEKGLTSSPPGLKSIQVREVGTGVNSFKVYRGSVPLRTTEGRVGHAFVLVAAGQQAFFRGDLPFFLRSPGPESIESFYRPVSVLEFRNGTLFTATGDLLPIGSPLPDGVPIHSSIAGPVWTTTMLGGSEFETLVMKGDPETKQVVLLCMPSQGTAWHLFNLVKVLVYYLLVVIVVLVGYLLFRWIRRIPYQLTFRDRLLVALLLTAVVPLVVIAYYGKDFAEQRLIEETAGRLQRETGAIAVQVARQAGPDGRLDAAVVEGIAEGVDADFNYYIGTALSSTSRPELFAAGFLDRRLSGTAYAAVMIDNARFFHQTENVGRYQYAVGYRPVRAPDGTIIGVVSVPTIYRQDELDRQISQQNAFLFGVYAVVFLFVVAVSTTVASRIASPIHRLTEATKRVSRGDLDVTVGGGRAEGEIGELVRSFETMTRNLRRQRDELIRYERELAWKEMAKQVAHEIKNPLTPMKLSLQHLRQVYRDRVEDFGAVLEEIVAVVIRQIDTLSRIASEFSYFAQMPKANLELCDLNGIAAEAARLFEGSPGLRVDLSLHRDPIMIMADKEMLGRAFINVIRNGIQAMNSEGRLTMNTEVEGRRARFIVRDEGPGIPDEIKDKLFQPNFSTKTDGMGLGLSIVKKTIDDLRGDIRIESRHGEGTTVTITLDLAAE